MRALALGRLSRFAARYRPSRFEQMHRIQPKGKRQDLTPATYLKDVLERLPTQPAARIGKLLPHNWRVGQLHG